MPRDASAVAVPGFCCFSGPDASDLVKQTGTKMPFFQVPSSDNDSAEIAKLQNPLFQRTLKDDPQFETQVKALERMLKVRERVVGATDAAVSGVSSGKSVPGHASGADGRPTLSGLRVGSKKKFAAAGVFNGNSGLPDGSVSALSKLSSVAELETSAGVRGSPAVTTFDEFADPVNGCAPVATAGVAAGFKKLADPVNRCAADATAGVAAGFKKLADPVNRCAADATAGVAAGFKKLADPVNRCAADATAGEAAGFKKLADPVNRCAADATAGVAAGFIADPVNRCAADATAGVAAGFKKLADPVSRCAADATAGESERIISLRQRYESDFPSLNSSGCAAAVACACWPAAASSSSFCPAPGSSSSAVSAVVAHARFTPMHDAHNSCSDTAINSLRVQRATSYNPEGVVAHNSRRKVRLNRTVGSRSVVQTVDICRQPRLLEHIDGLPTKCMTSDRSLGEVGQRALGVIQVQVLVQAVGLVLVGGSQASLRPTWRFLAHW